MNESKGPPTVWAGMAAKINIGNYESNDVNFGFSGVPVDCSAEYLQEVIAAGIARQQVMIQAMAAEIDRILREDYGR